MGAQPAIHFTASTGEAGQAALNVMLEKYGQCELDKASVIVALGGDGFMLRTLHQHIDLDLPVYGMKTGNVGFLMNQFSEEGLQARLQAAQEQSLYPLKMHAVDRNGEVHEALAINEVSLLRQTNQAAHIRIFVNDSRKVKALVCDGVLLSTTAGSTAYNFSVRGPILPMGTEALALTPISPFRPRRWRGAVLPASARVRFEILDPAKRPVSATADAHEVRDVQSVEIFEERGITLRLLFDPDHSLEERILNEQFR